MTLENYRLKLSERKGGGTLDTPRFSLSYKVNHENINTEASYNILSALKEDNDIVMEINTSLANASRPENEDMAISFLHEVRSLGLDYSYRKVPAATKQSILSQIFGVGKKDNTAHEIFAYVPDKVWKEESFRQLIPVYGTRYYITKGPEEDNNVINEMSKMLDTEKVDFFKLIVFDVASFGQMGIVSNYLTGDDIKNLLGL